MRFIASSPPTLAAMTDYVSTIDLSAAVRLLRDCAGPITILTHAKPDGDAFGSVVALTAALRSLGKSVTALLVPPVPLALQEMRGFELVQVHGEQTQLPDAELYVVVDTGAWAQLGPLRDAVSAHLDRTLIIDHHLSGDVPAAHRYIDGEAAACCEIIAQVIEQLLGGLTCNNDKYLSRVLCDALFVGIASDTGWFRFSNTRPQTHELAAKLTRQGVNQSELYQHLEQAERPEKLALLIRALDSLKLLANGRAAVMVLRGADFDETGAFEEETERLVDIPQQVGAIQAIALVSEKLLPPEQGGGRITRVSFRSKPGEQAINVADLAARFGGGGHARAAGAKIDAPVEQVLPEIEKALAEAVNGAA